MAAHPGLGLAGVVTSSPAKAGRDAGELAGLDRALKRYNNDDRYVRAVRAYAAVMQADERAYLAFHAWEVYFRTTAGRVHLPVGYDEAQAVRAIDYLAR